MQKQKLKTVIIISDYDYINGGNSKVALNSAVALRQIGFRVIVFTGTSTNILDLEKSNVEFVSTKQKDIVTTNFTKACINGVWNAFAKKKLDELLERCNPNETIIHFHGWNKVLSPSIWEPVRKRGYKLVVTMHDFFLFCPNLGLFNYPHLKICDKIPSSLTCYLCNCDSRNYAYKIWRDIRQLVQWYELKQYGKINIITIGQTNDRLTKKFLASYIDKCYIINNPISLNSNDPIPIQLNDTYIFTARLSPEKGLDMFCQSMRDLGLKGCVLGDGPLLSHYKELYPDIEFPGWVSGAEKEAYIQKAKALVFPSRWYEGAPLTPVEMKSYGIPCIVPDLCAASEVIKDGIDGYIFKIGDVESLKDALVKYENTDLKKMQERLLNNFDFSVYSMDTHVKKLIDCYNDILYQD